MAETTCFFGLTNVRTGSRFVAVSQIVLESVYLLVVIIKYFIKFFGNNAIEDDGTTKYETYKKTGISTDLEYDNSVFTEISYTITIIYASYYLRKATHNHNLQFINFWLIVNGINLITTAAMTLFASIRIGHVTLFFSGFLISMLWGYMLYVVYQFYVYETSTEPGRDQQNNQTTQNGVSSSGYPSASFNDTHAVVEIATEETIPHNHY